MREVKTLLLVRPPRSPRDMSDQENGVPPPHDAHELGKSNAMSANELCTSSPELGNPALPKDKEQEAYKILEKEWEDDPGNARNWSPKKKWTAVCIVSAYTFTSPLASSMMAPGIPQVAIKYGITDPTLLALTLSIFLLSFAFGPLILAPLSEMYGRTWVLHVGNIFTAAFSLGCAFSPTTASLIVFRFLSGFAASAPIACGSGSIADLFAANDRASAMALYSLGPLIGPVVGPVAGGFIAQTIGIKWVFITIAITCGACGSIGIPLLRETYGPVIRLRRVAKYVDTEMAARAHAHLVQERGSKLHVLWINLSRPIYLLTHSLICFILSLYVAFIYGIFYLMFATYPEFFDTTYGFTPGIGGLAYLGLGFGFLIATFFGAKFADQIYKYLAERNGGVANPEMRVPALFFGSFFVPIGLFWYGWSAEAKLHWIMPIAGSAFFGFGVMTTFLPVQLYLVDSFKYAASVTAAASFFRSMLGFVFPLFGQRMFDTLGLGGGNSLLAGLAIVLGIPFPVFLYFKGAELRASNPLTRDSTLDKDKDISKTTTTSSK